MEKDWAGVKRCSVKCYHQPYHLLKAPHLLLHLLRDLLCRLTPHVLPVAATSGGESMSRLPASWLEGWTASSCDVLLPSKHPEVEDEQVEM